MSVNAKTPQPAGQHDLPAEGFVRFRQVLSVIPVSRSAFLRGVKTGSYPAPVKLGKKTVAWRVCDVRALIERLAA